MNIVINNFQIKFSRWKHNCGIFEDLSQVDIQGKCPLGVNMIDDVVASNIQCKWIKLTSLYK